MSDTNPSIARALQFILGAVVLTYIYALLWHFVWNTLLRQPPAAELPGLARLGFTLLQAALLGLTAYAANLLWQNQIFKWARIVCAAGCLITLLAVYIGYSIQIGSVQGETTGTQSWILSLLLTNPICHLAVALLVCGLLKRRAVNW